MKDGSRCFTLMWPECIDRCDPVRRIILGMSDGVESMRGQGRMRKEGWARQRCERGTDRYVKGAIRKKGLCVSATCHPIQLPPFLHHLFLFSLRT